MKKILLFWALLLIAQFGYTQTITPDTVMFENFSNGMPSAWNINASNKVVPYQQPFLCQWDTGLQTPGVGQTTNSRFITPELTYDADHPLIMVHFQIFVFNSNMDCNSAKDFPCTTYVRAMVVKPTYSGGINDLPASSEIYTDQTYEIYKPNTDNALVFEPNETQVNLQDGDKYRIYFDFKKAEHSNCTGMGTKYVFDDFLITDFTCFGDCPPVANTDYFDADQQLFSNQLSANVFGGFLKWTNDISKEFALQSLNQAPAVYAGLDFDGDNHPLSAMSFVLVDSPEVITYQYCPGTPPPGTVVFNSNGTFTYTRGDGCVTRVKFTYKIIDPTSLESSIASVFIDFPPNSPLPVTFGDFSAVRNKTMVAVKWETRTEMNNRGFYVQCNTGSGWVNKAFVFSAAADGYSNASLNYSFNDLNTFRGVSQYRIAQVDIDGAVKYSNIQLVNSEQTAGQVHVYPNPSATGMVNVILPYLGNFDLALFDLSGRKLKEWKQVKENSISIDRLTQGTYILRVTDIEAGSTQSVRLMITR